jgi:transcription elongation factor GreA
MPRDFDAEYLSREKFDELTQELEELRTVRRKEIAKSLEYAKSLGDLSENAEYHEAREEQAKLEERIMKLEELLKRAVLVDSRHTTKVEVGSSVTVRKQGDSKEQVWQIVGSEEADFAQGKISNASPFGYAMLGKKKGEYFDVTTPKGHTSYEIVTIA